MASYQEFLGDMEQCVATKQVQFRQHQLPQHHLLHLCVQGPLEHSTLEQRSARGHWFLSKHSYTSLQELLHWSLSSLAVTSFFSSLLIDFIYCNHLPTDATGLGHWECAALCTGGQTYKCDVLVYMIHGVPQILLNSLALGYNQLTNIIDFG